MIPIEEEVAFALLPVEDQESLAQKWYGKSILTTEAFERWSYEWHARGLIPSGTRGIIRSASRNYGAMYFHVDLVELGSCLLFRRDFELVE